MPQLREILERLAIVVEQRFQITLAELDGLVHRQALDHAPVQAERGIRRDLGLACLDFRNVPDHAVGNVVERRDDPRRPGLARVGQADVVVGTKPAPGLLHGALHLLRGLPGSDLAAPMGAGLQPPARERMLREHSSEQEPQNTEV